jgi:hypothetical protein
MTLAVQSEARQRQLRHSTAAASKQQPPVQRAAGQTSAAAPADDPMDVNAANVVPFNGKSATSARSAGTRPRIAPGLASRSSSPASSSSSARPAISLGGSRLLVQKSRGAGAS